MAKSTHFEALPGESMRPAGTNGSHGSVHSSVESSPPENETKAPAALPGSSGAAPAAFYAASAPSAAGAEEDTYVFPASREQTRYWMLAQLDPESTASNMAIAFEIEGVVAAAVVEQAIAALTMRHEALRTIFRLEAGVLSQVVLARPLYAFTFEDLTAIDAERQAAVLEASVSRHGHTQIDLAQGPVLHALLIQLNDRRHVVALTMNHIVCDGWSNGILIRDFTLIYEALAAGREAVLPELPFQFADFSIWQNEYLESPAATEAATFWKTHITSDLSALDMPTDRARPAGRSFPGHIESALLPRAIDDQLKDYCRKTGSTKHIVLLAAFEALCARYTGQSEFLLGSTIANRTQPGMEDVVGRFANPQIIVAKVFGDPTFSELEQRVRDWETAAYTHQDLPFSRIIEDFQIDQAGATSQFLQVWFLYQKAFMQPQMGETIRVTPRRSVSGGVDFDLLVSVVERAEGPRIQFEYNTVLFTPGRIVELIESFIELLGEALTKTDVPLSELARRGAAESLELRAAHDEGAAASLHATTADTIAPRTFPDFLAARLAKPGAIACTDEEGSLSWAEVDRLSSSVAEKLRLHHGLEHAPIDTLAVVLAPKKESLVALLAALKMGIRVMPLPAHTDIHALPGVAADPGIAVLASRAAYSGTILAFEDFAALPVAEESPETRNSSSFVFLVDAAMASFAEFPASQVLQNVQAALPLLDVNADSSLLVFPPSTGLDACIDLLLTMVSGAQLNFAESSSPAWTSLIAAHEISNIVATPSQAKAILSSGWAGDRRIAMFLRGERLPQTLKAMMTLRLKSAVYGLSLPGACGYIATQILSQPAAHSVLSPIEGTTLAVKDAEGRTVPTGAFGELCVTTMAAADLHSGIMARTSSSGIEISDRSDRFIQLRGHRVCLGDVEDAAYTYPGLTAAAALVTNEAADPQLVLYAAAPLPVRDTAGLRRHLGETLPSHLIPSEYIWMDALPLTADGRLDAGRLPKMEAVAAPAMLDLASFPVNDVEQKLAAVWKDVLDLKSIDVNRSFFELGGSSLLLVRLFARVNKAFGTSLPITTIFEAKTIAALARMLGASETMSHLVRVQPEGAKPPLFMIHSYLLYQGVSISLGQDQPFYGLRELEQDGQLNIEQRARRYVAEIQDVQPHGPYYLAGWCAAGPLTIEVARHLRQAGEEIDYLALFDSWLPGYMESIQTRRTADAWLPYKTVGSKLRYHRHKMRGFGWSKKVSYLWLNASRMAKEARYRLYVRNWERLHQLSQKYQFSLPQFMHNTSLETFSALKEYHGQKLDVRLTLIRASDSREVPGAAPACGWDQIADKGVDVLWAPGDHETMFMGKNLQVTSDIVQRGLETAASGKPTASPSAGTADAPEMISVLRVDCPST